MAYNKDLNYQSLIDQAVKAGNYKAAGQYEQQRNEKIDTEGLGYSKTNNYTGNLDTTDYSTNLNSLMNRGASTEEVSSVLGQRNDKIASAKNLSQYSNDDVTQKAIDYIKNGGGFTYESAPAYVDKYADKVNALYDQIMNREAFSYDAASDPLYQQYEEQYTRNGQRAAQDTLGQVSARTGGLASSYAGSASQQSYNNYMTALDDKIPELQQLAYSMYQDEGNAQRQNLDLLMSMQNSDYSKYLNDLGQYNTDRGFSYGQYRDKVGDNQTYQQFQYQQNRDTVSDDQRNKTFDYNADQDQKAWDYQSKSDLMSNGWEALANGMTPSAEQLAAMGITDASTAAAIAALYKAQLVKSATASSGGSGGGGSGGSGGQDYDGLYAAAYASPNAKYYIASNYKNYGFTTSTGLADGYESWRSDPVSNGQSVYKTDYSTLVSYVQKCMKNGRSADYMYDALNKQGYSDAVIDQVFAAIGI